MTHWLAHVLGIDTQQSYFYDWWSGAGTQINIPVLLALGAYLHKHNCARRRCPLLGRHTHDGSVWCGLHHPRKDPS